MKWHAKIMVATLVLRSARRAAIARGGAALHTGRPSRANRINIDTGAEGTGLLTCIILEGDKR